VMTMTKMMTSHLNELGYDASRSAYLSELPDAIYWPFERLHESKLDAYAMACVETALRYSEDVRQIYAGIVQSWELPGCQAFIGDLVDCKQDTRTYLRNKAKAVISSQPLPSWPSKWNDVITKAEDNTALSTLRAYAGYLIVKAFNRKIDLDNHALKVLPRESPYLGKAVVFCSLLDYLSEKPELRGPRVISDTELTEFRWFCRTLASNPTTRMSRQVRRQIVRTLRKKDFTLHHYQTIVDGAEMWYRARVLCDIAREAADYYHIDAIDLSKRIEPYDDATGWPRHR